jgi:hypothetical protein
VSIYKKVIGINTYFKEIFDPINSLVIKRRLLGF